MDMLEFRDAWRQLLPPSAVVCAGPPIIDVPALTPEEVLSGGMMDTCRKLEFAIGRAYAKQALSELGIQSAEVLRGSERAPVWPGGVTGSITHTTRSNEGHYAAAVVKTGVVHRIGIDAEIVGNLHPTSWPLFLTARELMFVRSLPVSARASTTSAMWCAKEAATKALGRKIDPLEIEIYREGSNHAVVRWRVNFLTSQFSTRRILAQTTYFSILALGTAVVADGDR